MSLSAMNSRAVKQLRERCIGAFGAFLTGDYVFFKNEKGRVFIISRAVVDFDFRSLRHDRIGLYFALLTEKSFRLSKEGAALLVRESGESVGPIVDLSKDDLELYFQGVDVEKDLGEKAQLIILRYEGEILGCASYKNGVILNYLPKAYRGTVIV